jgi:hypothetical protein
MAVATIGVFGVMVMIPFAVKQSQSGLDRDAANIVGRNATETIQAYGFLRVAANPLAEPAAAAPIGGCVYYDPNPANGGGPALNGAGEFFSFDLANPQIFHIDPIRMSEDPAVRGARARFPQYMVGDNLDGGGNQVPQWDHDTFPIPPNSLLINSISGANNTGVPLTKPEANRLFRSFDNLVYGQVDYNGVRVDDVSPPQQYFDTTPSENVSRPAGNSPVRRQASGRVSWSALMVPIKDDATVATAPASTPASAFRAHVLVYADRNTIDPNLALNVGGDVDPSSVFFVGEVARNPYFSDANAINAPADRQWGYVQSVREIPLLNAHDIESTMGRDDWVMLINRRPVPSADFAPRQSESDSFMLDGDNVRFRADEDGYAIQVAFCRVLAVDNSRDVNSNNVYDLDVDTKPFITVDGGSFDFYNVNVPGTETYVVHLPNVINVYERTISVER